MGKMFTEQEVRAMLRQVRKETRQEILSEKKRPRVTAERVVETLNSTNTISGAATMLGVTTQTMRNYMRKHNVTKQYVTQ